jgi:hypothetical protein
MAPQQESDPLAELARLIGQADPFHNLERPDPRAAQPHDAHEPAYRDDAYAQPDQQYEQYEPEPEPEEPPPPPAWLQNAQHAQQAHLQQAWAQHEQPQPAVYEPHPDDRQYVEAQRAQAHGAYPQEDSRYDETLYGRDPNAAQYQREASAAMRDPGPPYAYPGHEQGYDEYENGEEQGSRRRGGMMTVAAVIALAVVGTAGAFAYRSFISGTKGEPPVIRADASPSKVVPPAPSKDPSGKVITDRIGQTGERVVSREEQPVDVASNAATGPRVVFPPLTQNTGTPPAKSTSNQPAAQANAAMSGGVMEEPKRIRTLSIKPDQAESAPAPSPQASVPAVPVPPRTASVAAPQPQAQRAPAASNSGPMQLAPQASNTRTAAVAPAAPVASAPAQGGSGYFVQVSSQRSEGDAVASYKALQSKFPGALGSRQATIRRADLAAGTYYRALVGPFASSEDATQMCASLKAAGGVCLVQRN